MSKFDDYLDCLLESTGPITLDPKMHYVYKIDDKNRIIIFADGPDPKALDPKARAKEADVSNGKFLTALSKKENKLIYKG
jgi:hypothetical protein